MDERTLRVLEFVKIRDQLASLTMTPMGAEKCKKLVLDTDITRVQSALAETEEATVILSYFGGSPMVAFDDVRPSVRLAEKGSVLSARSLLQIASCLRSARSIRAALVTERENTPRITSLASGLTVLRTIEDDITNAIISEDEISDNASRELADIRRHIRVSNDKVKDKLNSLIHNAVYSKYLMDAIITVRNDRYVVPVKSEYRQQVPGLVHDQSATGATLFVEPMAVVELNNEIKEWQAKEKIEIQRILASFSADIAPYRIALEENVEILATLDFIMAKGLLSRSMRGVEPKINNLGQIKIIRGRHPLLNPDTVVPSDLWMGKDFTTMIITGPNTGGKTVTLKTVGLLTLMAQSGLHVPADLGTELAVFERVYADIGDEQSIEQSLSTFSSHMKNIVEIMTTVMPTDLVLFDELGAGTDPTEGAALAQSILDALLKRGVRTLATTHYSELKAYALSTKGVENASVEFNVETLRPTYRLSIGVPGKSNAFEISRKLGLPDSLIESAKELLSHEAIRFEDVIANAEYHRQVAEREQALAEEMRRETVRLRDEAEKLRREMEQKQLESIRKAKAEAKRIVENAKEESETIISELKQMKKNGGAPEHQVQQLKKRMEEGIDSLSEGLAQPTDQLPHKTPDNLKIGDEVNITHLGNRGVVLSLPDSKGEVMLQVGIMKMKAHLTQLEIVNEKKVKQKSSAKVVTGAATRTVRMETDVRGMMLEEAIVAVDLYLDEAVLAGLHEVSIIHGKGTGALRAGIQQHLKRHPHVKSFRLGVYGEGESGVTVVELK